MRKMTMTLAVLCSMAAGATAGSYEMADLQALDKQGQWDELLAHLNDIPPSKRDAKWEGLAERAVTGHLGAIKVEEQWPERAWRGFLQFQQKPRLGTSRAFSLLRMSSSSVALWSMSVAVARSSSSSEARWYRPPSSEEMAFITMSEISRGTWVFLSFTGVQRPAATSRSIWAGLGLK